MTQASPGGPPSGDLSACSSIDLLDLVKAGNRDALELLFDRYLKPLRKWASGRLPRWVRDMADTQDLVQDVLLQTFKRIELFEPERTGALEAYLHQAVINRIREEFRRKARRPMAATVDEALPSGQPSPLEQAIGAQLGERYEQALIRLRPEERDLIVGRIELDLSYEELAQALGRPTANAARSAVVRAMLRLAEEMGHE